MQFILLFKWSTYHKPGFGSVFILKMNVRTSEQILYQIKIISFGTVGTYLAVEEGAKV